MLLHQPSASVKTEKVGKSYSKSSYSKQKGMFSCILQGFGFSIIQSFGLMLIALADDTKLEEMTSALEGMAWN